MKVTLLEKEFVTNANKSGDNKFVQVTRNDYGAIYQRFNGAGESVGFEVFAIQVVKAGELFGKKHGAFESYPGASAFGRTAWDAKTLWRAEEILEEIVVGKGLRKAGMVKPIKVVREKVVKAPTAPVVRPVKVTLTKTGKRRGRKATSRPTIVWPAKFTMKELVKANKGWTQPTLYFELHRNHLNKTVKILDRVSGGRGRPTVVFGRV